MHSLRIPAFLIALLVALLADVGPLAAQSGASQPTGPYLATPPASANAASPSALSAALRKDLRRGRILVALGSGIMVAGIVHAAAMGHRGICYDTVDPMITPLISGTIVAGVGLGMTFGGGVKIAGVPLGARRARPLSARVKAGVVLGAIGAMVATSALLVGIASYEWVVCSAS